jgi:predicted ATPase
MRAIITGGPSVGKTTIISMLAGRGFSVIEEVATQVIKEGVFLPWLDRSNFQSEVLRRQIEAEEKLSLSEDLVFLDRGLFDGEAYYIYDGLTPPEEFEVLSASHYDVAFMVEELPFFDKTDVRREDLTFSREISVLMEYSYTNRDVPVIRVPAMSPEDRVDFVLGEVKRLQRVELRKKVAVLKQLSALMSAKHSSSMASRAL